MATEYKVTVLSIALHDMERIVSYIAGELASPIAADNLAIKLSEGIEPLSSYPYRCPLYVPPRPLRHEFRKLRIDRYLVLFWASEEDETVTVARVLYAKRDLPNLLEQA